MGEKVNRIKGIFESKEKKIDDLAIRCADKIMSFISEPCAELQKYQVGEVPDFLEKGQINDEIIKFLEIMAFDMARVPNIYKAAEKVRNELKDGKHFSELYKDGEKNKNESAAHAILGDSNVVKDGKYGLPIFLSQSITKMFLFAKDIDELKYGEKGQTYDVTSDDVAVKLIDDVTTVLANGRNGQLFQRANPEDIDKCLKWLGELNEVFCQMYNIKMDDKSKEKMAEELEKLGDNTFLKSISNEKIRLVYLLNQEAKNVKVTKEAVKLANKVGEMYTLVSDKFKNTKNNFLEKAMQYLGDVAKPSPTLSVKFDTDVAKTYNKGSMSAKNMEVTQLGRVITNLFNEKKDTRDNAKVELNDSKKLEKKYNEFEKEYLKCIDELSKLVNNNNNANNILKYIELKSKERESNLDLSNVNNITEMYALKLESFCKWSKGLNDGFNIIDNKALGAKKLTEMKKITEEAEKFLENYREYLPESEGQKQNVKT